MDFDEEVAQCRRAVEEKLKEMGLIQLSSAVALQSAAAGPRSRPRKPREVQPRERAEPRRSNRERKTVTYNEDAAFRQLIDCEDGHRRRGVKRDRELTDQELEALRLALEEKRTRLGPISAPRGPRDSGKGVRVQGGRMYDSAAGITCHWCRQKTVELKLVCTHPNCGGGRRLPVSFCGACLRNRHGEDIEVEYATGKWVCPCCRGSCGLGCVTCCNCGPCRKRLGQAPTHQAVHYARASGFDNVHDYLVSKVTAETPEQLQKRKELFMEEVQKKAEEARVAAAAEKEAEEAEAAEEDEGEHEKGEEDPEGAGKAPDVTTSEDSIGVTASEGGNTPDIEGQVQELDAELQLEDDSIEKGGGEDAQVRKDIDAAEALAAMSVAEQKVRSKASSLPARRGRRSRDEHKDKADTNKKEHRRRQSSVSVRQPPTKSKSKSLQMEKKAREKKKRGAAASGGGGGAAAASGRRSRSRRSSAAK